MPFKPRMLFHCFSSASASLIFVFVGCSSHTINLNPEIPSNPSPPNGAKNVSRNVDISWVCSDPENEPLTYDIYFGTTSPPPLKISNHGSAEFEPGNLNALTKYYWYIVARDSQNNYTEGPQWNFTTNDENFPPNPPSNPRPKNGEQWVPRDPDLFWDCTDPDNDPLLYDVYLGTSSPPPLVKTNHNMRYYDPGPIYPNSQYYWRIVAKDNHNNVTWGPLWTFFTDNWIP